MYRFYRRLRAFFCLDRTLDENHRDAREGFSPKVSTQPATSIDWNERIPPEFPSTSSGKLAISLSFEELAGSTIDSASTCTPCRYRLIDCDAFLNHHQLCIYEFTEFPDVPYAPLSYPWRGNPVDTPDASFWKDNLGTFTVRGAEDGDPVSIDVLIHVCTAALKNCRYIWLDRLCIMQTSKEDKVWQISRMYMIYASCEVCCILPGGIRRLVSLEEDTSWIHRGWTLQEAIVPKRAIVIFWWDSGFDGPRELIPHVTSYYWPEQLIGNSAWADLNELINGVETMFGSGGKPYRVSIKIFSHEASRSALLGALHTDSEDEDIRLQAIWRSALLRTSSRPVDMVFSIMHIFGVSLDPRAFDKNDRLGVTIALAREILRKGGKAHWIGAAYSLDPSPYLSTFAQFPETSVEGRAYITHADGSQRPITDVMDSRVHSDCWLTDVPTGSMDEDGYLTFMAHAVPVTLVERNSMTPTSDSIVIMVSDPRTKDGIGEIVTTLDGSLWQVHKDIPPGHPRVYIVLIGEEYQYATPHFDRWSTATPWKGLLIKEHAPGKFHKTNYVEFQKDFRNVIIGYKKVMLTVGGPNLPPKGTHHL